MQSKNYQESRHMLSKGKTTPKFKESPSTLRTKNPIGFSVYE